MREMSVLLPTLGNPTRATSATRASSSSYHSSWPFSPCSAKAGARRLLERKLALPLPPRPPSPASHRSPGLTRSARTVPSWRLARVPTGTGTSRSAPRAPCFFLPPPWPPSPPRRWGWSRKPSREDWLVVATSQTLPPRPPSPPSGPPLSTWASRRNATAPAPPSPAFTCNCASSTKPDMGRSYRSTVVIPRIDGIVSDLHEDGLVQPTDRLGHPEGLGQCRIGAVLRPEGGEELLHRLGHHVEDRRGELLHRLDRVGVLRLQSVEEALHGQGAERVVLDDRLVGDTQEGEHQGGEHPGPILPGAAVDHRRKRVGRGQDLGGPGQDRTTLRHHLPVTRRDKGGLPPLRELLGGGEHVGQGKVDVVNRHQVDREPAALLRLVDGPQVDHRGQSQTHQLVAIGRGQLVEPVGPEQAPPPDLASVDGPVPAEIAKVHASLEIEGPAGQGVWLSRRRRRRPACAPCGW